MPHVAERHFTATPMTTSLPLNFSALGLNRISVEWDASAGRIPVPGGRFRRMFLNVSMDTPPDEADLILPLETTTFPHLTWDWVGSRKT